MKTATIFNMQRFSIHDGPGIRTTVFLKGCPLRCAWCHNPESMDPRREPLLTATYCIGCALCAPVCPEGLTGPLARDGAPRRLGERCARCGQCADACPTRAREFVGRSWSSASLLEELRRDAVYHAESGGGVTFSGGEPLAGDNAPFVLECLEALGPGHTHTAVDTCGHVATDALLDAARLTDLILYDLKLIEPGRHADATGVDNSLILRNLSALLRTGCPVWIRVPMVAGQTDDDANLDALARFLNEQASQPPVWLLPYHSAGTGKYVRLGRENSLPDTRILDPTELEARAQLLRDQGLRVHVGG